MVIRFVLLGVVHFGIRLLEMLAVYALITAILGALAGGAFATVMFALARGRTIQDLPSARIVALTGIIGFALGAAIEPGYQAAVVFGVLAACSAAASMALALRAPAQRAAAGVAAT